MVVVVPELDTHEANTSKLGPPTYLPVTRLSAFVLLRPGAEIVLFLVGKSLA